MRLSRDEDPKFFSPNEKKNIYIIVTSSPPIRSFGFIQEFSLMEIFPAVLFEPNIVWLVNRRS